MPKSWRTACKLAGSSGLKISPRSRPILRICSNVQLLQRTLRYCSSETWRPSSSRFWVYPAGSQEHDQCQATQRLRSQAAETRSDSSTEVVPTSMGLP